MPRFILYVDTDNAAFHDPDDDGPHPAAEVERILRKTADRIALEGLSGFFETIRDHNGNDVGRYALKPTGEGYPALYPDAG